MKRYDLTLLDGSGSPTAHILDLTRDWVETIEGIFGSRLAEGFTLVRSRAGLDYCDTPPTFDEEEE